MYTHTHYTNKSRRNTNIKTYMICTIICVVINKEKKWHNQTLPYLRIIKPIAVSNEIDTRDYITTTVGSSSIWWCWYTGRHCVRRHFYYCLYWLSTERAGGGEKKKIPPQNYINSSIQPTMIHRQLISLISSIRVYQSLLYPLLIRRIV